MEDDNVDDDGDVDMLSTSTQQGGSVHALAKQCFSPIQRRKLASAAAVAGAAGGSSSQPLLICQLCPSMDLIIVAIRDTLWIHRTMSWQRLATWKLEQEGTNNEDDVVDDDCQTVCCSAVCWSPDGRSLAIARHLGGNKSKSSYGAIELHQVEALSSDQDSGPLHTIALPHHVVSLLWAHVGQTHSTCPLDDDELERHLTWHYQARYLDRASTFLPPSSYYSSASNEHHHAGSVSGNSGIAGETIAAAQTKRPSCHTPLSLLCATTKDDNIHLYLHGRFDIATLDHCARRRMSIAQMACTSDLTTLITWSTNRAGGADHGSPPLSNSCLTLFHLPALATFRYPLQVISSLYCSMTCHLTTVQQGIQEVAAAWKSSLKPLDTKLIALQRLLKNYNVPSSRDVRSVLHQYLVTGSTEDDPVTNALEAFFSNVQMNDQLIQRLERSLHSAVANVETLARKVLLAPALALVYDAGELQSEPTTSLLIDSDASIALQRACNVLVLTVQDLVARLVEARFRLRDLVSWLRSAGSQVKARGTAANSGQAENAKRRRVPHATVQRMAMYLQGDFLVGRDGGDTSSFTESLIGISIGEYFSNDRDFMHVRRPASPTSVGIRGINSSDSKRPTVAYAFMRARAIMNTVFEQPKSFVSRSITQQDFALSPVSDSKRSFCAIHSRLGGDPKNKNGADSNEEGAGFFSPQVSSGDIAPAGCCRSWSIVAHVASFQGGNDNSVHVFALPLGWREDGAIDEDTYDHDGNCHVPFYLSCRLVLPSQYRVKEIAFYGDDGNSSLSVGTDSDDGPGKEGRQAMGLLVSCPVTDDSTNFAGEELWLAKYDHAIYHSVFLPSDNRRLTAAVLDEQSLTQDNVVSLQPFHERRNDDAHDDQGIIYAKTRRVSLQETGSTCRILMSGSRGVGGVLVAAPSHVELDVFDLEEDADDDATEEGE